MVSKSCGHWRLGGVGVCLLVIRIVQLPTQYSRLWHYGALQVSFVPFKTSAVLLDGDHILSKAHAEGNSLSEPQISGRVPSSSHTMPRIGDMGGLSKLRRCLSLHYVPHCTTLCPIPAPGTLFRCTSPRRPALPMAFRLDKL